MTTVSPRSSMLASDEELVAATLAGDMSAFERLVERYRDLVVRVAARIVGREEAEDVAQDSLLRAFHRLDKFRHEAPFRSWLLRIVHNTALNHLARRVPTPVEEVPEVEEGMTSSERSPARNLEERERRDRLAVKLTQLRPQHRSVLVLRDVEGLSYEEISAVTEMPLGSVKGRLHRARAELVDILRNNTYDWDLPGE